jgi:hypothetical protein
MGKTKVTDKEMNLDEASRVVLGALQAGSVTTPQMQQMFPGYIPLGDSKGRGAMWNIDLAVNQPLVDAEMKHILGILDGREEGHDLVTVTIPDEAEVNSQFRGRLTVPSSEVWYVVAVQLVTPGDQGGTPAINWRCSLWEDRSPTPSADGQAFHANPLSNTPGGDIWHDEFHPFGAGVSLFNKPVALRLPAGAVITAEATNLTAAATDNMACTLRLKGYIGKALVG